ncbi:hypothetical protein [Pseudomonas sp. PD9R]|uniref:hypothetical protein n=1 Tax=Pseudomonas sp. PD9R TaxID=2853534 RepID=UPI001C4912B7|nr:hypothetical protein [Pseudomonas sp. PD9R]MBV6826244.1 hypothetical protein [Pseudomonas sp. PD9R]
MGNRLAGDSKKGGEYSAKRCLRTTVNPLQKLPQAAIFDFVFEDQDQKIAACGSSYRWLIAANY